MLHTATMALLLDIEFSRKYGFGNDFWGKSPEKAPFLRKLGKITSNLGISAWIWGEIGKDLGSLKPQRRSALCAKRVTKVDVKNECSVSARMCVGRTMISNDFLVTRTDGDVFVRECVQRKFLTKPMTVKLLDASREYWLKRGVTDWGLVIDAEE